MKKSKKFLSVLCALCMILAVSAPAFASSSEADSSFYDPVLLAVRSNPDTVYADSATGVTNSFTVHELGRVRFYVWNANGIEDLTITVHKQAGDGSWGSALKVNGQTSFLVLAGENKGRDTDGNNWTPGEYRFEAESTQGNDYVYYVDTRELDYTP